MDLQFISEYIVKIPSVLSPYRCNQLMKEVDEESLNELLSIQAKIFNQYSLKLIPEQLFIDIESSKYSFECDKINVLVDDQGFYNFGSSEQSNRFMTFMFIVNNSLLNTKLNFPLQKETNICRLGDMYILPANFPHRFKIELAEGEIFTAVSLHLCFVVDS